MIFVLLSIVSCLDLIFMIGDILHDIGLTYPQFCQLSKESRDRVIDKIYTKYLTGFTKVRFVIIEILALPVLLFAITACFIVCIIKGMFDF